MEWRPVVGYEGLYEVSDTGIVRGLERITTIRRICKGAYQEFSYVTPAHVLKYGKRGDDYPDVPLTKDGKSKNVCVHRLVAEAFIPNPDNLRCVNHKDGNKRNNCVENLEWVTHQQNNIHAVEHKMNHQCIPVRCIETQQTFPSMGSADRAYNIPAGSAHKSVHTHRQIYGYTFEVI